MLIIWRFPEAVNGGGWGAAGHGGPSGRRCRRVAGGGVITERGGAPRWLLSGRPGIGKTTVVRRVIASIGEAAGGFTTEEVRERGRRVGFRVQGIGRGAEILAHVDLPAPPSVGRYGVDLEAFERVGIRALEEAIRHRKVLIIDEIGKMELLHPRFREVVERALDSGLPMLATVLQRRDPFGDQVKRMPEVDHIEVTSSNRDDLPGRILSRIDDRMGDLSRGREGESQG